jgi:hypothetical protein
MGGLQVKNLCQKQGRFYYRRKVNGKDDYIRLPPPWHPDHARAYQQAAHEGEREKPADGSLAALVAAYRASSKFKQIPSPKTRANDSRYLDMIVEKHGHRSVKGVTPFLVIRLREDYQDRPGVANNWLRVFRTLMKFAAQNGWRKDNPASGIEPMKLGEHEPWPSAVLAEALAKASPMLRLAIVQGVCSGARIGDSIRMAHNWHDGAMMEFTASKNKADVAVPMHPLWLNEIAKVPLKAVTILHDRSGKSFKTPEPLQKQLRDLMKKMGKRYTFHGLRKNACCYLAELGLSDMEIGAIVGMTAGTVRHYSKRKRAYMIAKGAADRVTKGDVLQLKGGRR